MDNDLYDKWLIIARNAYLEYQKHTPAATDWPELTEGQKEGFAAATFHGLFSMEAVDSSKAFIL